MSLNLKIVLIIVSLFIFISTLGLVRKNEIPIKYSLVWLLSGIVLLFVSLFPNIFGKITNLLGFQVSSNLVVGIFIFFLLFITRMLTRVVSEQKKQLTLLTQEISMIKKLVKDNEKK